LPNLRINQFLFVVACTGASLIGLVGQAQRGLDKNDMPQSATRFASAAPHLWFHPPGPISREKAFHQLDPDFDRLFDAKTTWQQSAARVEVFKFYASHILGSSDVDLKRQVAWLRRHNMAVAVEAGILTIDPTTKCGGGVEGYGYSIEPLMKRLKDIDADLEFITMDEPLFFGHEFAGRRACRSSISALARQVAENVGRIRSYYPLVKFIDVEPVANFKSADLVSEVADWLKTYQANTNEPMFALFMDVAWWVDGGQRSALRLTQLLRSARVPVGVIYDGPTSEISSGQAWIDEAKSYWRQYESLARSTPDYAVFQSWAPQPKRYLPETSPDAFTNLLLDYINNH